MKHLIDKTLLKRIVDFFMTIVLLLLMAFQITGQKNHEWIGTGMLILFIIHNGLNIRWYKNWFKGKYRLVRMIQTIINILILMTMIAVMIRGIIMSRYAFDFLNITGGMMTARLMHLSCSYWAFVLMSIHLGFHWGSIIRPISKIVKEGRLKKGLKISVRVIAFIIAAYGVKSFYESDIWSYMTLKNQFAFLDFEKSAIAVFRDNMAMMGCFVFISYYVMKELLKFNTKMMKEGIGHNES